MRFHFNNNNAFNFCFLKKKISRHYVLHCITIDEYDYIELPTRNLPQLFSAFDLLNQ